MVWLLVDASQINTDSLGIIEKTLGGNRDRAIIIANKQDLVDEQALPSWIDCAISAKLGEGVDRLLAMTLAKKSQDMSSEFSARQRHLKALSSFTIHVEQALASLHAHLDGAAEDLRQAQNCLSVMTGAFHNEDLLDQIFSTFCLGK